MNKANISQIQEKAMKDQIFKVDNSNAKLTQKLDELKRELSKVKIDISSAFESKAKALNDTEFYNQKKNSSLKRAEKLRKEIEEANEEHVLVELARIEAEKELREIESQRADSASKFSEKIEKHKKRISELRREITGAKEVEEKLAATQTDLSVLQNEMQLIRAMSTNFPKKISSENELSNAKQELGRIREEGFQFMSSMDSVRLELLQISEQTDYMKKQGKKTESTIEHLNSKLLKERSKLESIASAVKTEIEIKCVKNKLVDKMAELGKVKASESAAIASLKSLAEKMVERRAIDSRNCSVICVSMWEYEYLRKKAELANDVADKKVAAFNAWIEAIKEEEKELLLKCEVVEKEMKVMGELVNENSITGGRRRSKTRRVSGLKSGGRSPSFAIKRRKREKKASLAALFGRRWNGGRKGNKVDFDSYASNT